MLYCPSNISLSDGWDNHGFSRCFSETVFPIITFSFILIFGTAEVFYYYKYGTVTYLYNKPRTKLFYLQTLLALCMPLSSGVLFALEATAIEPHTVYGFSVLWFCATLFSWLLSIHLVLLERNYMLPSVPASGHSLILLTFWSLAFIAENLSLLNLWHPGWWFGLSSTSDKVEFSFFVFRYFCTGMVFLLGLKAPALVSHQDYITHARLNDKNNASINNDTQPLTDSSITGQNSRGSTFKNFWKKMKTLMPFIWPKKKLGLQLIVIVCFMILVIGRVANVYSPIYNKIIVDSLLPVPGVSKIPFRWDLVLIVVGLKFIQGGGVGGMGFLNNARNMLWLKIQQFSCKEIQMELFDHLHSLSLRWHLQRKTGEVLRVIDRGTTSISTLLSYILFSILPTVADIIIAIVYFVTAFNAWFGLIVFVDMSLYLATTIVMTEWRTKYRRAANLAENKQNALAVDSLLNFETVKYYGAEAYEVSQYKNAIEEFQDAEWMSNLSLTALNFVQNFVINGGLLVGSLLCVHMVTQEQTLSVGDYVLFSSYILQLYIPLNWFGTYYRLIQKSFIDMENMFDLLEDKPDVKDAPYAKQLILKSGSIQFRNVCFHYVPEREIIKNVSFEVDPGSTVAFVGPSGCGKSTLVRLIFRLYDVQSGSIIIDGRDIRQVTQRSLRQQIGVVPQDTVLFNNSIRYNIRYGRISATDAEVEDAAKVSDIHEKILNFPQGYETQVGERGLKLSGGEKQRVAIARTVLKSPGIVLLDEATSALDTKTERNVQSALNRACQGRTAIVIAHRLSTIVDADLIFVMQDGEIVERGRHEELLSLGGVYSILWQEQQKQGENNINGEGDGEESASEEVRKEVGKSAAPANPTVRGHPHHHPVV